MSDLNGKWESIREEMDAGHGVTLFYRVVLMSGRTAIRMPDTDENEKIARLIAAAPDLLESCESAKLFLEPNLVEPGRTVFWKLVDAIAKAKIEPT